MRGDEAERGGGVGQGEGAPHDGGHPPGAGGRGQQPRHRRHHQLQRQATAPGHSNNQ